MCLSPNFADKKKKKSCQHSVHCKLWAHRNLWPKHKWTAIARGGRSEEIGMWILRGSFTVRGFVRKKLIEKFIENSFSYPMYTPIRISDYIVLFIFVFVTFYSATTAERRGWHRNMRHENSRKSMTNEFSMLDYFRRKSFEKNW